MKNTVKVERAIKDITQQELAAAVGVSRQTINSTGPEDCQILRKTRRIHL